MARKTKFNSVERQLYQLGREVNRNNLFPTINDRLPITALRERGVPDEELAFIFEVPLADIEAVAEYDKETASVLAANDKTVKENLKSLDMELSTGEFTVELIKNGKESQLGGKKKPNKKYH